MSLQNGEIPGICFPLATIPAKLELWAHVRMVRVVCTSSRGSHYLSPMVQTNLVRNVLVVFAHPEPHSFSSALCQAAVRGLESSGCSVTVLDLYAEGFDAVMSAEERRAYESGSAILDPMVARHAAALKAADGLLFIYPTWWFGVPAIMKGWLERVMVPDVAFSLHPETNRLVMGLTHLRRVGGVSTYGSPRANILVMTDGGRRVINRCVRLMCGRKTKRTWLGLYGMDRATESDRQKFLLRVESTMAAW